MKDKKVLEKMSKNELEEFGLTLGADIDKRLKKSTLVDTIMEFQAVEESDVIVEESDVVVEESDVVVEPTPVKSLIDRDTIRRKKYYSQN